MFRSKLSQLALFVSILFMLSGPPLVTFCQAQTSTAPTSFDPYVGIYALNPTDFISIAKFDLGDGQNHLLFTDFKSGAIRILSAASADHFTAGPGLLLNEPAEIRISFVRNKQDEVTN